MGRAYLKIVDVPARGAGQRKASSGPLPFGVSVPEQRHFASSRALQRPDRPGVSRMTMAPTWVSSWPRTGRAVWRDEVKVAARRVVVDAPESTRRADSRKSPQSTYLTRRRQFWPHWLAQHPDQFALRTACVRRVGSAHWWRARWR